MRFAREPVLASPPYAYDTAWNQVREPDSGVLQVLALVTGATLCVAVLAGWLLFAPFKPVRIDYATFAVAALVVVVLHEFAHAVAFTMKRGSDLRVGFAFRKGRLSMRYEGAVGRNHYVLVLTAPLLAVSLLPVAVASLAAIGSGDVVLISMLNALISGSDVIAAMLVLVQVPAGALIRRQGDTVLWKPGAARA